MELERANLVGAYLAIIILSTGSLIFILRLQGMDVAEHRAGVVFMLTAIPLTYLLWSAPQLQRPSLYYVQLGLMIGFILLEFLLDYALKADFRKNSAFVIPYVMFFFAGTGGMIGVASHAGRGWTVASVLLFLIMAALAFLQRAVTGM